MPAECPGPVVVVGGGPVGAALALALGQRDIEVTLIERERPRALPGRFSDDLRVFALSPGSRALLIRLGVGEDALGHPYHTMHVEAERESDRLDFAGGALGSIAEYGRTSGALWSLLEDCGAVRVVAPASVSALTDGVELEDGTHLPAALVVGADGARSRVAQLAGAGARPAPPRQHAVVTTVETSDGEPRLAWQRFMETGPLAFLPLGMAGERRRYSIVWSAPIEMAEHLTVCGEDDFARRLERASRGAFGQIERIDQRVSFPITERLAGTYVAGRSVVLVGDAAHVVHPLAGQGLNMGLRDVAALADVLSLARDAGCALDDPGFQHEYRRRRAADNLALGTAIALMQRLWTASGSFARLRSATLAWLRADPAARTRLARVAMS